MVLQSRSISSEPIFQPAKWQLVCLTHNLLKLWRAVTT